MFVLSLARPFVVVLGTNEREPRLERKQAFFFLWYIFFGFFTILNVHIALLLDSAFVEISSFQQGEGREA